MHAYKAEAALMILRVFAGIIFFFQGYDKLFKVKITNVIDTFLDEAAHHHVNRPLVTLMAWYSSLIEFIGGIALIFGLFTHYALYLLGIDLILAAIAFSVLQPVWDMRHVFPRLILVATLLLMPAEWNTFSIDFLLSAKN